MKHLAVKALCIFVATTLCLPIPAAFASEASEASEAPGYTKSETVYASLQATGAIDGIYVVNNFEVSAPQRITDFGNYEKVINLSTSETLTVENKKVSFDAEVGNFFYQGNMGTTTVLPWKIQVSYLLDGKHVTADELSGASGKLEILLKVTPDTTDPHLQTFVDNYLLQVSTSISTNVASSITAEGATLADAGSAKSINYMVLPGESKECTISAEVTDFFFDGFQIAGVPLSLAINLDEQDTSALSGSMGELQDAIAALDDGAQQLSGGSSTIASGLGVLSSSGSLLSYGSAQVQSGLSSLSLGLEQLSAGSGLYYQGVNLALRNIETQVGHVPDVATAAYALQMVVDGQSTTATNLSELPSSVNQEIYDAIVTNSLGPIAVADAVRDIVNTYLEDTVVPSLVSASGTVQGAQQYYDTAVLYQSLLLLRDGYTDLNTGIGQSASGAGVLAGEYSTFDSGVASYVSGVGTLASNYGAFNSGVSELASGTTLLRNGTINLDQELLDGIKEQFSSFLGGSFTPQSFVDARNASVSQVQFIFMVDGVLEPVDTAPEPEVSTEPDNPWTRLLALFGL